MKKLVITSMTLALLASISVASFAFYDNFGNLPYEVKENNDTLVGTVTSDTAINIQTEEDPMLRDKFEKAAHGFISGCTACSNYGHKYLDAIENGNFKDAYTYADNAGRAIDLATSALWISKVDNANQSLTKWDKDVYMMRYEFSDYGYGSPQLCFVMRYEDGKVSDREFDLNCNYVNGLLTKLDNLIPEVKEELGKLELAFQEDDLQ